MKASVVSTVLNEEKSVEKFIDSIASQSVTPLELVITDAASKDKTVDLIKRKIKEYSKKFKIVLITKKGNRSVGRNEAIKKSNGKYIAVTDVGCIPDNDWLKNITKPFIKNNSIDVVSGYYKPTYKNIFEKSLSTYTSVMPDKLNADYYVPSSRSIAFRKEAWKNIGGYPENLDTCEDLVFAKKLKEKNFKFILAADAIVKWPQRRNLVEASKQFFSYAKGDGFAKYFRPNTPYLFLRYVFAAYLLFIALIIKSMALNVIIVLGALSYVAWAINKNYKYVNDIRGYFYLPLLQFTSDISVILGTSIGFIQQISFKSIVRLITTNKSISLFILFYSGLMLYLIQWGIPNLNHPFNYAMDEWHFSQALRTFIKYGTGSISGAASIPLYHIVSSIIFVIPFYVLQIVNPLSIKNTLDNLPMQHILFIVLRLHTLFYGVLSIIVIYSLFKRILNFFPRIFSLLFIFSPIYLSLTNYYKYDVTLVFWITLSLYLLFKYLRTNKYLYFILASVSFGLALSTKFTAAPFLIPYVFAYFIFSNKIIFKQLLIGILIACLVFLFVGIPDMIFGKGSYFELLYSTLIQGPTRSVSYNLGYPSWYFLFFKEFPSIFGYFFTMFFYISFLFWSLALILYQLKGKIKNYKIELFTFVGTLSFLFPILIFNVDGGGNRALVILPFMVILSGLFMKHVFSKLSVVWKKIFLVIIILGICLQIIQSASWISVKFYDDPRAMSSEWIIKNLPKDSIIGIENIPIYQMLPDVVLKEFYGLQQNPKLKTKYRYQVLEATDSLPKFVVVTNDFDQVSYINSSSKKSLVKELEKQNYVIRKTFSPNLKYYKLFSDEIYFIVANVMPIPVNISIYEKQ
jgi:glycosyltransferase involved in cell wall biosynthesis